MTTTQIFNTEGGQAIRLPSEFHFDTDELEIRQIGEMVVLFPKESEKSLFLQSLGEFTPDFLASRDQPELPEERESL